MEDMTQDNADIEQNAAIADDAVPVCPNCLEPCHPLDNYCPHCDSNEPINPLASYMPFVDVRFRFGMIGKLWRKTWASDTKVIVRVIYLLMFMVFLPFFLLIGLSFVIYEKLATRKEEPVVGQEGE
ncbi:MAG: hypothetical protein L0Y36_02940 [Planctomycetales bacterium]|nr:hypothetical protein [Planctomycetales bacterium]